ncbi:MAG TPA: isoaspartyl peptidase/L-asparaginase [Actinomycetota bacterium]|nr:isoaspartyl peptidase/L-asparaginase [Actinomycetota bacterium]
MSVVFVHGGVAGVVKPQRVSLAAGVARGEAHERALDAVEHAVIALEDHPELNAGYGAVLNLAGAVELDAGISDGATGRAGGVGNVTVRNPISLARKVLEETPHVLITGAGAIALGAGMELVERAPAEVARWEEARAQGRLEVERFGDPVEVDTVGAVAVDGAGGLAAASSTGGVFGKMPGRMGDSAVFGAGHYASKAAAVVGTGVGEMFLETLACARAGMLIEAGAHPQSACEDVVRLLGRRAPLPAGLLAVDRAGRHGAAYRGGSWDVEGPDGPVEAARVE